MPRPAPMQPDFDNDDDPIGWDDGDNDSDDRPAAKPERPAAKREEPAAKREASTSRREPQPAARRERADPALTMPSVHKDEALGLGGKKPAAREPSFSAGDPLASDYDQDNAPVVERPTRGPKAPAEQPQPSVSQPETPLGGAEKTQRAAKQGGDVGGLLYLIALAILAASMSAAVVLMFF